MTTRTQRLHDAGVSIWLDTLSRELLQSGEFERLLRDFAVTGATSNPTIFAKAITSSDRYDEQIRAAVRNGIVDPRELFFLLALDDVRHAADLLRAGGRDGFVSFECTPDLAHDSKGTIEQAMELWRRLDRANVMIKVPATPSGIPAIEELTRRGVNVNVTLLFSLERYEQVIDAYLTGLERRAAQQESVSGIASVASFFVSRVDTKADRQLAGDSPLRGRIAVANAARAYDLWRERFAGPRWQRLQDRGARPQRPLWASTGTKDSTYSDVLYVDELIAPSVVNTMPMSTLEAFADHGVGATTLPAADAGGVLEAAAAAGLDLTALTAELEREGVEAFCASYQELLDCLDSKASRLGFATSATRTGGAQPPSDGAVPPAWRGHEPMPSVDVDRSH
jgi:transaldolase